MWLEEMGQSEPVRFVKLFFQFQSLTFPEGRFEGRSLTEPQPIGHCDSSLLVGVCVFRLWLLVMSFAASRVVLRQSHLTLRRSALRNASTTSEAVSNTASKAKETASNATSKAAEGLSRVTSSAGSGVSRATEGITKALGRMGGRTGRLIAFVQCE